MCLTSVIAAGILLLKENILKKLLFPVVSISSGVFIGSAFLFLIPESMELFDSHQFAMFIVLRLCVNTNICLFTFFDDAISYIILY